MVGGDDGTRRHSDADEESSFRRWLVLDGDRLLVAALITFVEFAALVALGLAEVVGVTAGSTVTTLFASIITGQFTIVTITISINQLILSRILGSPEQIREHMRSVESFRGRVEEMAPRQDVSPVEPRAFLRFVLELLADRTARVDRAFADATDPELARRVGDLVVALRELTDGAVTSLDEHEDSQGQESLYGALSPVLDDKFSQHLHTLRSVRVHYEAETTDDQRAALGDLETVLEDVNLTRHYLKTLHTHAELSKLTQLMLLTGVPAFLIASATILAYANGTPAVARSLLVVVVAASFAVTTVPLSVLASYVLRVTAVARRTTTQGAFVAEEELP